MFRIAPHFRLQEWVAEEKGYVKAEEFDDEFHVGRCEASVVTLVA